MSRLLVSLITLSLLIGTPAEVLAWSTPSATEPSTTEPEATPQPLPDVLDSEEPTPATSPSPHAEPKSNAEMPIELSVYTLGGWMRPDLEALNLKLSEQNFQTFNRDQFTLGGGFQLGLGHVLSEFQGGVNISLPAVNNEYITNQSTGFGLFNVGYIFRPTPDLRIYPILGIGMGFLDLQFTQRNNILDFDSFLKNPGRQGQISAFTLLLNAGLGLDYFFHIFEEWGFRLGIRGGWLWAPLSSNFWQVSNLFNDNNNNSNNNSLVVPGGPNIGLTGPYAYITLGF
jgi:hypothetical protein